MDQDAHNFQFGDCIYWDGNTYSKAVAANKETLALGVVIQIVDVNKFIFSMAGQYEYPHGLEENEWWYLSDTLPGGITNIEPDISQPIIYTKGPDHFFIYPYRPSLPTEAFVFQGAGTQGIVPDPITEDGKVLSDSGEWITVQAGYAELDGGFANAVYLPTQLIDGGTASG